MKLGYIAYGVLCYAAFGVSLLWAMVFIAPLPVAGLGTVDHGPAAPPLVAMAIDLALLGVFAVQHTVMARPAFKARWTRIVPAGAERSTFVLAASLALILLFWQWRPIPAPVWTAGGALEALLWAGYAGGWLLLVVSTFMIDHLDLFGLRQSLAAARGRRAPDLSFTTRWLYAWIRHPIMTGFLVLFWLTPRMTLGHLLFAAASSAYIAVGVWFEERDLLRLVPEYAAYRRRVGAVIPRLRRQPAAPVAEARPAALRR